MPAAANSRCSEYRPSAASCSAPCTSTTTGTGSWPGGIVRRPASSTPLPRNRVSVCTRAMRPPATPSKRMRSQPSKATRCPSGRPVHPSVLDQPPLPSGASAPLRPSGRRQRKASSPAGPISSTRPSSRRQLPTSHRGCDACAAVAQHITASATSPPVQSMRRAMARSSSEGWDTGWHAAHAHAQHYATKRALWRRKPRCGERKTAQVRQKKGRRAAPPVLTLYAPPGLAATPPPWCRIARLPHGRTVDATMHGTTIYYHGTRAGLAPGDPLEPGRRSNYGSRRTSRYIYLSATLEAAIWGAELAVGEAPARVYIVEPTGPIEDDPNLTNKRYPGN